MTTSELDDILILLGKLLEEIEAEYTNQQKPRRNGAKGTYGQ